MTKRLISLGLIVVLLVTFVSCGKKDGGDTAPIGEKVEIQIGGSMKMASVYVDTMNPLVTEHASVMDFLHLIYEGLFVTNTDLTVEGVLASDYTVSDNNTIYTITLKDNITFHNGKRLTADDVVATIDYMRMYSDAWSEVTKYILTYASDGDNKVIITLVRPKADFVCNLDFPILPSGLTGDDFAVPNSSFVPVGTGMYRYDSTRVYKNIILKSYDSWMGGEDRAYIDEVNIEILSDEETIISAFDAGTTDALTTTWRNAGEMGLTSTVFNTFKNEQNRFTFVGINTKSSLFDTDAERQALWKSIDRQKLASDIMLDMAVVASTPVRDGVYYDLPLGDDKTDIPSPSNDEAGATPIQCKLLYNSDSKTKNRIAVALKQQLESRGYMVELDGQSKDVYNDRVMIGDYELYVGEVQLVGSSDMEFMFSSPVGSICNYDDSEFRTLVSNLDTVTDSKEKEIAWQSFKKYYQNAAVQIPLYFTNRATFVNKRISGSLKPNLSNPFYGLDDMFIK